MEIHSLHVESVFKKKLMMIVAGDKARLQPDSYISKKKISKNSRSALFHITCSI